MGNSQRTKLHQLHACFLGHLADRLLVVFDERLLGQAAFGVEVAQAALDHLGDDVLRLAFLAGGLGEDFPLLGNIAGSSSSLWSRRAHGGDVHADIAGQFSVAALELQQHADRAIVMGIAAATAVDPHDPLDLEHLADLVVQVVKLLFQRGRRPCSATAGPTAPRAMARAGARGQLLGQVGGQLHEVLVAGHRGAFAAEVDHRADIGVGADVDGDTAGSRGPAGPFLHQLGPRFAKQFDGLVDVAVGLLQGLLAVHHGRLVRSRSDLTAAADISAIWDYLRLCKRNFS